MRLTFAIFAVFAMCFTANAQGLLGDTTLPTVPEYKVQPDGAIQEWRARRAYADKEALQKAVTAAQGRIDSLNKVKTLVAGLTDADRNTLRGIVSEDQFQTGKEKTTWEQRIASKLQKKQEELDAMKAAAEGIK